MTGPRASGSDGQCEELHRVGDRGAAAAISYPGLERGTGWSEAGTATAAGVLAAATAAVVTTAATSAVEGPTGRPAAALPEGSGLGSGACGATG